MKLSIWKIKRINRLKIKYTELLGNLRYNIKSFKYHLQGNRGSGLENILRINLSIF